MLPSVDELKKRDLADSKSEMNAEDLSALFDRAGAGDRAALDEVFGRTYQELRDVADRHLRHERPDHTLQATALVNEAYMKIAGSADVDWRGRTHLVGIAARAMRQVLVDHARRQGARKRGGDRQRTTLAGVGLEVPLDEILALDRALDRLERIDPRLREVVEYRFFAGLTSDEIAETLGVTRRTVQRDWSKARAWLHRDMSHSPPRDGS
jgi:RNA polymerase sigma factor (TIGR02999 family)